MLSMKPGWAEPEAPVSATIIGFPWPTQDR